MLLDMKRSRKHLLEMRRTDTISRTFARLFGLCAVLFIAGSAGATELVGPGRFCGYSPIIDLLPGERITPLDGGIHGGSFRWDGPFGSFEVHGIGWASPVKGRMVRSPGPGQTARFAQRRVKDGYEIAIWNGKAGTAYFRSKTRFGAAQIAAIDRVRLFDETEPEPTGCKLRTIFVWE